MSGQNGVTKPCDVTNNGDENPIQTSGAVQTGGYAGTVPMESFPYPQYPEILQGVPAQTRISISGDGVIRVGAPNQSALRVSLATGTVQLDAHVSTSTIPAVISDSPIGTVVWLSRQRSVATIDGGGRLTLIGQGSTTIEARYSRAANRPFANASPSPTEGMAIYATLDLVVTA